MSRSASATASEQNKELTITSMNTTAKLDSASTGARLANVELAANVLYFTSMTGNHERAGDMVY